MQQRVAFIGFSQSDQVDCLFNDRIFGHRGIIGNASQNFECIIGFSFTSQGAGQTKLELIRKNTGRSDFIFQ